MDNFELDKYLEIVNEDILKRGLDNYLPLYPMLRVCDNNLYIGIMLTDKLANVWDKDNAIKPEYWLLIDVSDNNIIEFNKTEDEDFVNGELISKNINNKQKEISEYTVCKTLQYKEYLMSDIKNDQLPIQKKISNILNNYIEIDGDKININDYLIANMEFEIEKKVDELVNLVVQSKYGSITFYYCNLFNQIIDIYKKEKYIDIDKIKLCIEIMDNYYDGVIGIRNFFNV